MGSPRNISAARLSTGCINTSFDKVPGSLVQNNTGVPSYSGLLGERFVCAQRDVSRRWNASATGASAAPSNEDLEVRYVQIDASAPVTPATGQVLYWKSKSTRVVTNDDTQAYEFAGICPGAPAKGDYFYMITGGEPYVLFISPTTKNGTEINGTAVAKSGNTGKADVLADATAQTYGLERDNQQIGRLTVAIDGTTKLATVSLFHRAAF